MDKKVKEPTLKSLVLKEAKNLRKLATKKEIENLNFETFYPKDSQSCVYGQMCNGCFTPRANTLIRNACERVYKTGNIGMAHSELNGSPKGKPRAHFWSPIEVYITRVDKEKQRNLISFIKGERKTL